MLGKAGFSWDEINIYHHPESNKHLGLARVILRSAKQIKSCIEKFNNKSVMGKVSIAMISRAGSIIIIFLPFF
jgi:[histone H3]-lysine4 N-trimethyltransferase SETD1